MATDRPPDPTSSLPGSSSNSSPSATLVNDQGRIKPPSPFIKRTYQQIITDANDTENNKQTITLKITKIYDPNNSQYRPQSLDQAALGYFIFEVLCVKQEDILGLDLFTGRYNTHELILNAKADVSSFINQTFNYREHNIEVQSCNRRKTKVTFKFVPYYVPDEEILHLCLPYGVLVDGIVHKEKMKFEGSNSLTYI